MKLTTNSYVFEKNNVKTEDVVVLTVRIHMMFDIVQERFESAVDMFCLFAYCQKNIGSSSARNCPICLC